MSGSRRPLKLLILRPSMAGGGADHVTLTLLRELDRSLFSPALVLLRSEGLLLDDVPNDVEQFSLGNKSLWTAWIPLTTLLRAQRPDLLFSTSGGTNTTALVAHLLSGRIGRVILSERSSLREDLSAKKRLQTLAKRMLYPSASRITAVSEGVKSELEERLRVPQDRISVVYNPIVGHRLETLSKEIVTHPWFRESIPLVLTVGRLVLEKDHQTLLHAFAAVRERQPARLVLLGTGPLEKGLRSLARSLGILRDTCFLGYDRNPFKYMARCTVFVLSSRYEGLPGVLIQAMACGAPVISTDCRWGPAEIIQEPSEGILVPPQDPAALAREIRAVIASPELRRRLAIHGHRSAQRFAVAPILERYTRVLLETADLPGNGSP